MTLSTPARYAIAQAAVEHRGKDSVALVCVSRDGREGMSVRDRVAVHAVAENDAMRTLLETPGNGLLVILYHEDGDRYHALRVPA